MRESGIVGETTDFGQVGSVGPGFIPLQRISLLKADLASQQQLLQRKGTADEQVSRIPRGKRQLLACTLNCLRCGACNWTIPDVAKQRCELVCLAQVCVELCKLSNGSINQCPGARLPRTLSCDPCRLPGVDRLRKVAIVEVRQPKVGPNRGCPAGVRVGFQERDQIAVVGQICPLIVGIQGMPQGCIFGRTGGFSRHERFLETRNSHRLGQRTGL